MHNDRGQPVTQEAKLRQTSGEIRLRKLFVTEVRGSPAVHVVVLVKTRILEPFFASGELVDDDDFVIFP